MSKIQFFGIRHHGPGSAHRLKTALENWKPDLILIELPSDAQALLDEFDPTEMHPPLSILIYDPKNFTKAAYFPLAVFSPEWQALRYGHQNLISCYAIDLPMGHHFVQNLTTPVWSRNPFRILADKTDFDDVEQWWDHYLENNQSSINLFKGVGKLMEVLREDLPISEENKCRESYMRNEIRRYSKAGYERIAVVCGAFHVPGLKDFNKGRNEAKMKSKSTQTESIWIPWSYERLTQKNSYGAGVQHPSWYESIYHHGNDAPQYWLARTIAILRNKDLNISTAHSVEALRLIEALRKLRKKNKAGINELEHALTAVLFQGNQDWISLYGNEIFIGTKKGRIPKNLYHIPLQKDFRKRIKKARLNKALKEHLKLQKTLDLRKKLHKHHSRFFHQTQILQIPLAHPYKPDTRALGTFKETWDIEWDPVSEWTIVQAGTYGTTVSSAARTKLHQHILQAEEMDIIVDGLKKSFLCGFESLFDVINDRLILMYAVSESLVSLLDSLNTLLFIDQYGHIRWETTPRLRPLIERIAHKSANMLPSVILHLEEDTDKNLRNQLNQLQFTLNNPSYSNIRRMFQDAWLKILQQDNETDYYHGVALRQCMDLQIMKPNLIEDQFLRHFSDPHPANVLDWLDGMLSENILWMVYDDAFLARLNSWISQMDKTTFKNNLPVLRKIFTRSGPQERQKLFLTILDPKGLNKMKKKTDVPERIKGYVDKLTDRYSNF